jgi:hypothetical protein
VACAHNEEDEPAKRSNTRMSPINTFKLPVIVCKIFVFIAY